MSVIAKGDGQALDWGKIAKRIKSLREAHDLTQPELAAAIGKHRATIARVESGVPITSAVLYALARALKTTYTDLTGTADPLVGIIPGPEDSLLGAEGRDPKMIKLMKLSRELVQTIVGWEKIDLATLPLAEVMKVNRKAHALDEAIQEANEIYGPDFWKEDPSSPGHPTYPADSMPPEDGGKVGG